MRLTLWQLVQVTITPGFWKVVHTKEIELIFLAIVTVPGIAGAVRRLLKADFGAGLQAGYIVLRVHQVVVVQPCQVFKCGSREGKGGSSIIGRGKTDMPAMI